MQFNNKHNGHIVTPDFRLQTTAAAAAAAKNDNVH
jgi:hypothetical protein